MGTLTVTGASAGLAVGSKVIGPLTSTGTNTVGQITDASLIVGDNTFPVASGWTKALIVLGNGASASVTVRTNLNAGDTGLPIAPYSGIGWTAFDLTAGVTELILNSSGAVAGVELSFT